MEWTSHTTLFINDNPSGAIWTICFLTRGLAILDDKTMIAIKPSCVCSACGQPTGAKPLFYSGFRQMIYDFIRTHPGCNMKQIADHVYSNDEDGGAESNSITVTLHRMRPILASHGLSIICSGHNAYTSYHLIELPKELA